MSNSPEKEETTKTAPKTKDTVNRAGRIRFQLPGDKRKTKREQMRKDNVKLQGKIVELIEPTEQMIVHALELAKPWESSGQIAMMARAQGFQLRLALCRIGDHEVNFDQLEGELLHQYLNEYERSFLIKAIDRLTSPPDEEVEDFFDSMQML